ncbi:strG [Symbiodinium necroappetens]|uniref:StrG protein n=1 Tax=Symbiodinium necroappetens TaxID=1628268 RepID=A0A812ZV35_9DINO|nr:strG [Symbiodinium necroappetens]
MGDVAPSKWFGKDVRGVVGDSPGAPRFDEDLRLVMEPHLAKAREKREEASKAGKPVTLAPAPYVALRDERPFTFDPCTYPLHSVLAEALGVGSLADVHKYQCRSKQELLSPLLDRGKRLRFHELYDVFVTSFCIPMLHSLALKMKILNTTSDAIYRYQAFPCLRVVRPGEFSIGPHCDTAYGHSMGNLNFHVPLTPVLGAEGANALFVESRPGAEDWHPLTAKHPGHGFMFDGARCIHFTLENTTDTTRVSLDFRIALFQEGAEAPCTKDQLADSFCTGSCSYYDEAVVSMDPGPANVTKKAKERPTQCALDWVIGREPESELRVFQTLNEAFAVSDPYPGGMQGLGGLIAFEETTPEASPAGNENAIPAQDAGNANELRDKVSFHAQTAKAVATCT